MSDKKRLLLWQCLIIFCLVAPAWAAGQAKIDDQSSSASAIILSDQVVAYPADFFARYKPNTALDMVKQLPGFQLDDGTSDRGFISAVGNILINGDYPSAKQDSPSAILARMPANQVARIELIRGQARGTDLQGQSVVADIIMLQDKKAAVRWETYLQHSNTGPLKPMAGISLSSRLKQTEYLVGIHVEREANGERGTEQVFEGNGSLIEDRFDDEEQTGLRQLDLFLTTTTPLGETLLQFNSKVSFKHGPEERISIRVPQATGLPNEVFFDDRQDIPTFELGLSAERDLTDALSAKAILLYTHEDAELRNSQRDTDSAGVQTLLRIADQDTVTQEGIARLELGWTGIERHNFQFNMEAAYNSVDGSLIQTVDTGGGPVIVDVPGANALVEEIRGDFVFKDTWSLGRFELDYGLGAEVSTISQSGDTDQERDFFFLKPRAVLTYSPTDHRQTRFVLAREVAQLNFDDFISATVFEDDDLALGNPNLKPDTTWVSEFSHERRFGSLGVIKVTAFHHWISDVLDLLPLSADFEAPGNIGDGRRWGLIFESTVPLEWLGLTGARLDIKGRWQDSTVEDPVTGEQRVLSATQVGFRGPPTVRFRDNGSEYVLDIAFRQDFESARIAWGWDIGEQAERPRFKVDELDVYNEQLELNAFIESTRWFGIKIRLDGNNLLDYTETRNRTIYAGDRGVTPVTSQIIRERTPGRRIKLTLSGNF